VRQNEPVRESEELSDGKCSNERERESEPMKEKERESQ